MTRAAIPVLVYAALIALLAAMLWVWDSDPLPPLLLTVAAAAMGATGLLWLAFWRRPGRDADAAAARAVPDLSAASALLGVAITMMLVGTHLGAYAVLIGAGLGVLATGGLVREALAARRALERSDDRR